MPMDVSDALKDIFMCEGNLTKAEAENYMKQLIQAKRYQRETWSWHEYLKYTVYATKEISFTDINLL